MRKALRRIRLAPIRHPSVADFLAHERIDCLFDVGANAGQFGLEMRELGYRGRIISFEPVAAPFATLFAHAARDARWSAHHCGLGDAIGEVEIAVAAADVFTSFKAPSAYTAAKFSGAAEASREIVRVDRLDHFLATHPQSIGPNDRAFLKVDTQGFEKEVLLGAGNALDRFLGVQVELGVRQLYDEQESLTDMIGWFAERGFVIAMAKENGFDWQAMRLLELDVVFARH